MLSWAWLSGKVTAPEKLESHAGGFSYELNYKGQNNTLLNSFVI